MCNETLEPQHNFSQVAVLMEMLQDLIVAAVNDAQRKADDEMKQKTAGMLPPGFNL